MIKLTGVVLAMGAILAQPLALMAADAGPGHERTVTGEIVDLMCYLDHGAKGAKHESCAQECIKSGGPVGILVNGDQLYMVIGDHKPMNDVLAPKAGQTVTLKGKYVERNGFKMLENAELVAK